MTVRQQWAVVGGIVTLLAAALLAATVFLGDELFPVGVGTDAPDFEAAALTTPGLRKTLADYHGQVVLLNVWATWCAPCRVEMPSMQRLHDRYGPEGLKIVAVSIDQPGMEDEIRDFAREYKLTFEILHDAPGAIKRTYQTTGVPETFVIARDGTIRKKIIGATEWDSEGNLALVRQLLAERHGEHGPAAAGEHEGHEAGDTAAAPAAP